jgi:hypothetical protein
VPGAPYSLSFYAKGSGNFIYRVTTPPAVATGTTNNNPSEWQKYTLNFTAPAGVTQLRLDFTDVAQDKVAYVDDVEIHRLSSEKAITSFGFSSLGLTGAVNNNDISVDAPYGTDVTNLVADFTVSNRATVTVGTTSQTSGVTANDFSEPVTYTVAAEDGSTRMYTVTVTVANPVNVLTNAGFESGVLTPWTIVGAAEKFVLTQDTVRTGNDALQISGPQNYAYISQLFTVVPGAPYTLSFYAKGSGDFIYRVTTPPAVAIGTTNNNPSEWQKYTLNFTAPAGVTQLRLDFTDVAQDKAAYVDDVEIYQLGNP